MVHCADPTVPFPRRVVRSTTRVRQEFVDGIRMPTFRRIVPSPQRLDDVHATNVWVFRGPAPPLGKHALSGITNMHAGVDHELNLSVRANVSGVTKVCGHPIEVSPPLRAVAVILSKKCAVAPGLAIPADSPGLVRPGEHEGHIGLPIFEHSLEGVIHDWIAEPVMVVGDTVETNKVFAE